MIYGDIDMNIIDGSSIWIVSLISILKKGGVDDIRLLLKKPLVRDLLLKDVSMDQTVHLIDPFASYQEHLSAKSIKNLSLIQDDAAKMLDLLVKEYDPSIVLVRGHVVNVKLSDKHWARAKLVPYMIWKQPKSAEETEQIRDENRRISANCTKLLVQTESTRDLLIDQGVEISKIIILPPMIPDGEEIKTFTNRKNRLIYTGQIKYAYNPLEMIQAVAEVVKKVPDVHLDFVGDKVSKEGASPDYLESTHDQLKNSPFVTWHAGMDRSETIRIIAKADLGLVWRKEELDSVPEISTKMLEYGIMGKPVIANRNLINEKVLGKSYPLFANDRDEFISKIVLALTDQRVYSNAAKTCYEASRKFTYSEIGRDFNKKLLGHFVSTEPQLPSKPTKLDVEWELRRIENSISELSILMKCINKIEQYKIPIERKHAVKPISDLKELKVACILDEFSYNSFNPECSFLQLSRNNWMEELEKFSPHMLFVESAWAGVDRTWEGKVSRISPDIRQLVGYCKEEGIVTVFWNKEDPVHFERFLPTAKLFDCVFTTDAECIPKYRAALDTDSVFLLPFATQPLMNNPIEKFTRKKMFCFAGSFYANRHMDRQDDFVTIMNELESIGLGLDIYDRNFGSVDPQYQFPNKFKKFILGSLPVDQIDIAYKGYDFGVNFNSIKNSPTMFARRVFELISSNTLVVGNYSLAVQNFFGDLTISMDSPSDIRKRIDELLADDSKLKKIKLTALRKTLTEHTYAERMRYVVRKSLGWDIDTRNIHITVVSKVATREGIERVLYNFKQQTYQNSRIIIISEIEYILDSNEPRITIKKSSPLDSMLTENKNDDHWIAWFHPEDHYGSTYLADLALATEYTHEDVITKASYFEHSSDGLLLRNDGHQYRGVDGADRRSAMARLNSLSASDLDQITNIDGRATGKAFSIDEFNYCRDGAMKDDPVNDIQGLYKGTRWSELIDWAESIPKEERQAVSTNVGAVDLKILSRSAPEMNIRKMVDNITIDSSLKMGEHRFVFFEERRFKELLLNKNGCSIHLNSDVEFKLSLVITFLDNNEKEIGHVSVPNNTLHLIKPEPGAIDIKMGLRIEGSGIGKIFSLSAYDWRSIELAHLPYFEGVAIGQKNLENKVRIVFAGHDLKFFNKIIEYFESQPWCQVRVDHWIGHDANDQSWSEKCVQWADVVVCEWALGNLVYYSRNKRKGQILISRLHRQELTTPHYKDIDFSAVDRIVFIAPHVKDQYLALSKMDERKAVEIDNFIDLDRVVPKNGSDGQVFNIGIVGIVPKLKNPILALQIFELVWKNDNRSRLIIKGKKPEDFPWLSKKRDEVRYYDDMQKMIETAPWRNSIEYSQFGEDMKDFYARVGFVLSTSDLEGSHQSVGEALAAGCIPILRDWEGSDRVYTGLQTFHTAEEAAKQIIDAQRNLSLVKDNMSEYRRDFIQTHGIEAISKKWSALIQGLLSNRT